MLSQLPEPKEDKNEDPLRKYLRLENEIRLLANMGNVPSKKYESNPYQAQADQYESMKNPRKATSKRMREILGDGRTENQVQLMYRTPTATRATTGG